MELEEERTAEATLLQDAKVRLVQLEVAHRAKKKASVRSSADPVVIPPPPTWVTEMDALKARFTSVEEERATVRGSGAVDPIPLMPVHVPNELDDGMRDRNTDLQDSLSVGEGKRVSELILKLSEGADTG